MENYNLLLRSGTKDINALVQLFSMNEDANLKAILIIFMLCFQFAHIIFNLNQNFFRFIRLNECRFSIY